METISYTIKPVVNGWILTIKNAFRLPNNKDTKSEIYPKFADLMNRVAELENEDVRACYMGIDIAKGEDYSTVTQSKRLVFDSDSGRDHA